jgi:lysophospholipase L1-like esterase
MPGGTAPLMDRAEANIAGIREVDVGLEAFTSLESFRSHLDYLVELAQADGALVMVCTQAHMYGRPVADWPENMAHTLRYEFFRPTADTCIAPDSLRRAMAAARDIIVDIAHLRGALLLDAEALIHDDASCFLDDFHLVREGNDRIARAMADRLAPALNARSPSRDVKAP